MPAISRNRSVETFLPYMRDVDRCQRSLHELALAWRMIEGSTRMSCADSGHLILPTIEAARRNFDQLEQKLIHSLVEEKVAGVLREIGTKAMYIVDIVVRNLYERTADVAFLATDRELCSFMEDWAGLVADASRNDDGCALESAAGRARSRLTAYRRKYTVYDALALISPDGTVTAGAGVHSLPEFCTDAFIQQALEHDGYVEIFEHSCLQPEKSASLIYCHRMNGPRSGQPVGVLCLCFDLDGEMEGVFATHRNPAAWYNMLLLDAGGTCIASADPAWIPAGTMVPVNPAGGADLKIHAGRLYLVATHAATGYQGYPGPLGWRGQVMIPLDIAFASAAAAPADLPHGLLDYAGEFCPPLQDIMNAAETIRRVVWNGQVISVGVSSEGSISSELFRAKGSAAGLTASSLRAVLDQISDTGARSDVLFRESIQGLYETVVATNLQDAGFVARLMVDLLDRNLYERANDCRWWALTEELRQALERPGPVTTEEARRTLVHINSLYTVYTSIFLYDTKGKVLARSLRDGDMGANAQWGVDAATLQSVLRTSCEQGYVVEGFAPSPSYGGRSTYVYHAAIRGQGGSGPVVGGIGLVFDSAVEFPAMLDGSLAGKPRTHACFTDRQGCVIASSAESGLAVGDFFPLDADIQALGNGESVCRLVVHQNQYAIMAYCVSQGYREFKRQDDYRDDVIAVVYQLLGQVSTHRGRTSELPVSLDGDPEAHAQFAIFSCAGQLFAFSGAHVHEAVDAGALLPITLGGGPGSVGMLPNHSDAGRSMVWVYRLDVLLGKPQSDRPTRTQGPGQAKEIVVLQTERGRAGLLVDALHSVGRYTPRPLSTSGTEERLIREVIQASAEIMIPVLDVPTLVRRMHGGTAVSVAA